VFIIESLRVMDVDELKLRLTEASSGIHQSFFFFFKYGANSILSNVAPKHH